MIVLNFPCQHGAERIQIVNTNTILFRTRQPFRCHEDHKTLTTTTLTTNQTVIKQTKKALTEKKVLVLYQTQIVIVLQ